MIQTQDRVLIKTHVNAIHPVSDVTRRKMEAEGTFPRRFKINPHGKLVGWRESEVMAWIEERAASRDAA